MTLAERLDNRKDKVMTEEDILRISFQFIDENPDVYLNEVPEELLKCWHVIVPLDKYLANSYEEKYEYKIFIYALQKYCERKNIMIPSEKVIPLFCTFQMILMLPYIKRYSGEKRPVFRIFDFGFLLDDQ